MNGLGEVVPRDDPFIRKVINTRYNPLFDGSKDDHCQITCIGRCAYLVEDDTQFRFLLSQANHGLHEVIAKGGIEPGSADDHRLLAEFLNIQFTHKFRFAINAVRTSIVLLGIRHMLGAIKDIVSRYLDHPSATSSYRSRQVSWCLRIQAGTEFFVVLGLIDSRIGSAIDYTVNLVFIDEGLDSVLIGDIQLTDIRIKIGMLGVTRLQQLHFVSQLAITASD